MLGRSALAQPAQNLQSQPRMLTGAQIRAGRALLKWSTRDLAEKAGVHQQTVHRAEAKDGTPSMNTNTIERLRIAFEENGIEFVDGRYSGDGGPGVRLRK